MRPRSLAGYARLNQVAKHWDVRVSTAKALLDARGVRGIRRRGRLYYLWYQIWRLEGAQAVPPEDYERFREPLLDKHYLVNEFGLSERTARRWLAEGELPAIRLADRIVRLREVDLERHLQALAEESVAAERPGH